MIGLVVMSAIFCSGGYHMIVSVNDPQPGTGCVIFVLGALLLFYSLVEANLEQESKNDRHR